MRGLRIKLCITLTKKEDHDWTAQICKLIWVYIIHLEHKDPFLVVYIRFFRCRMKKENVGDFIYVYAT